MATILTEIKSIELKFQNLKKAYTKLCEACNLYDGNNEFVRDCMIYRFKFTYELCHKTLHEFMTYMGTDLENSFPRTIFKKAYVSGVIDDDKLWLSLINDRNKISHVYNENMADDIAYRIKHEYVDAIGKMIENINKILQN